MSTGRQQSIRITHSSGLSKEEIDQLVKDAELHAEEDQRKKELADARNAADALIYSTDKTLRELGEKVDSGTRAEVEQIIASLKAEIAGHNLSEIKALTQSLTQASHNLAAAAYQQASPGGRPHDPSSSSASNADEEVVDAEFEEVQG